MVATATVKNIKILQVIIRAYSSAYCLGQHHDLTGNNKLTNEKADRKNEYEKKKKTPSDLWGLFFWPE